MAGLLRRWRQGLALGLALAALAGCGGGAGDGDGAGLPPLVVTRSDDAASAPAGELTLRAALAQAAPGQPITFAAALDGATVALTEVADAHTQLVGEVMGMRDEGSGPVSYLVGWHPRDYGRSALVARKDVVIDASALPRGITLAWAGGERPGARVLAVHGNLTLVNVTVRGGRSITEPLVPPWGEHAQPWTLARGGALAVWGVARLRDCTLHDNRAEGDFESSRDRGAFGGAVYADAVEIENCRIAGNEVLGGGAAGGGVYVVGGAEATLATSRIERSAVSGNRIRGLFAYGGGVYTDGGGIGRSRTLRIANTTVANNLVAPPPGLPPSLLRAQGYWRGGGVYMSNGRIELIASTVTGNETQGHARTDSRSRANLAGGIAATVGDAHAAEQMVVAQSIVAGNTVQPIGGTRLAHDLFTGSLVHFRSGGHNRIGVLDFSQMLVPVGEWDWQSLVRRHWPQDDDQVVAGADEVLDLATGVQRLPGLASLGTDAGLEPVRAIAPRGSALGRVGPAALALGETWGQYRVAPGGRDDFAAIVLQRLEQQLGRAGLAVSLRAEHEAWLAAADSDAATPGLQPYRSPDGQPILSLEATRFFGPAQTWPRETANQPWIAFWQRLDATLAALAPAGVGPEGLGDALWRRLFSSGPLAENPAITVSIDHRARLTVARPPLDQLGRARPAAGPGDIGAVEWP